MNDFNYINTLKDKRNEPLSYNKNNIKEASQVRYALRYHVCMVSGVNRLMNKC